MFESKDDGFTIAFWWDDLRVGKYLKVFRPWVVTEDDVRFEDFSETEIGDSVCDPLEVFRIIALNTEWAIVEGYGRKIKIRKHSIWYFGLNK